jgi:hypothetical protein
LDSSLNSLTENWVILNKSLKLLSSLLYLDRITLCLFDFCQVCSFLIAFIKWMVIATAICHRTWFLKVSDCCWVLWLMYWPEQWRLWRRWECRNRADKLVVLESLTQVSLNFLLLFECNPVQQHSHIFKNSKQSSFICRSVDLCLSYS